MQNIYSRVIDTRVQIDDRLLTAVDNVFSEATDVGFGTPQTSFAGEFERQIKTNNSVFAAFKVHRMGKDIAAQLLDENGNLKPFTTFVKDTEGIVDHQVNRWLRTEYDTAVKRARKAADMVQFRAEQEVLPNIEWLPSTAVTPREEHMPFYHHIWPIDNPFWDDNQPGDKWGCQCDWTSTDESPTDNSGLNPESAAPSRGLKGNPGTTARLFSDDHPYFPDECAACPFNTRPLAIFTNKAKDCYNCKQVVSAIQKAVAAKEQRRAELVEAYKKQRELLKTQFGYDTVLAIQKGSNGGTGKLKLTSTGVNNCLKSTQHSRTIESKQVFVAAIRNADKLVHINKQPLGYGKDMTDPADIANVKKKMERGVVAYNYYSFEWNKKTWVLGFEELADGYEQPYFIAKMRK